MKTLNVREVIIRKPMCCDEYDIAHVVKETEVEQYGVHTDDYDFHVSYFDAYNSKDEAVAAMKRYAEWARRMGDNKYFYVTTSTKMVRRFFDIDMKKRNARAKAKSEYITPLERIAKARGFDKAIELLAIGLYYPAKAEDDLPPLTEDYAERADKVYFVRVNNIIQFLLFNLDDKGMMTQAIEVKDFDLAGGHFRWSKHSDLFPNIYDSNTDWDSLEAGFEFEEAPEF